MTVKCKHGTEVYKFRCPECADEERGRNMTADKLTPDMATPQGTVAPRHVPNCKHAYMNDGFDCPFCLRDRLAASEKENALLKGAMAADDERLRNAEKRIYPDVTWGCDAAEHMADLIIGLRSELADLRAKMTPTQSDRECAEKIWALDCVTEMVNPRGPGSAIDDVATIVSAHTSPIRAQLDEAVGHLAHCVQMIQWMSGSNDFSPDGQAHRGWLKMFPGYEESRHFIATLRGEGE